MMSIARESEGVGSTILEPGGGLSQIAEIHKWACTGKSRGWLSSQEGSQPQTQAPKVILLIHERSTR